MSQPAIAARFKWHQSLLITLFGVVLSIVAARGVMGLLALALPTQEGLAQIHSREEFRSRRQTFYRLWLTVEGQRQRPVLLGRVPYDLAETAIQDRARVPVKLSVLLNKPVEIQLKRRNHSLDFPLHLGWKHLAIRAGVLGSFVVFLAWTMVRRGGGWRYVFAAAVALGVVIGTLAWVGEWRSF